MTALDYLCAEDGFLGLSRADAGPPDEARVVVVPFGLEASVSYGTGTGAGPRAILNASRQVELFDEELWCEPFRQGGVATLTPREPTPVIPDALAELSQITDRIASEGRFPLVLGGEHSLTPGAVAPLAARHPELVVVQLDAHADLRDGYDGEHFSHAAAMRRCLDYPGVTILSFGVRSLSTEEALFLDANPRQVRIHWARDRHRWRPEAIAAAVAGRPVYLSFDLDALDSGLMPATGTPEPGGLMWDDALMVLRAVCESAPVVGADVVELAPRAELPACDFAAARLAYKIIAYTSSRG